MKAKLVKNVYFTLIYLLTASSYIMAQGHVASTFNEKKNFSQPHSVSLFQSVKLENLLNESLKSANQEIYSKSQLFVINDKAVTHIRKNDLSLITVPVSIPDYGMVHLNLYRQGIFTNDISVENSLQQKIESDVEQAMFYRGVVAGEENASLVSLSVFKNEISGVISIGQTNFNLGKIQGENAHILYKQNDVDYSSDFLCGAIESDEDLPESMGYDDLTKTLKCVRLRVEVDAGLYSQLGSTTAATNYVSGLYNHIITLYDNDNINLVLSEIYIWEGSSPYSGNANNIINQMSNDYPNADLTSLLSTQSNGGVAYISGLCSNNFGVNFSSVNGSYNSLPSYSWDVNVVAHEIGHNLSSPHTHSCSWNGNNTPIDGCGPDAGYFEGCSGSLPAGGGTIMSYCHLTSVGIDFTLGFGPQPTTRMTNYINNSFCLGSSCVDDSPTCDDEIQNGAETGIDCGGSCGSCSAVDVTLDLRAKFQGPFDSSTGLMYDNLRVSNKIPLTQPYTALGFMVPTAVTTGNILNVSGVNAVVDWVMIELRSGSNPINVIATQAALIQRDGDIIAADGTLLVFENIEEEEVYVAIRHRNHFGIRTGIAHSSASQISIDFTSFSTNVFGLNAMEVIDGSRVMISGDANLDGQVNSIDKNSYWRLQNAGAYNYWNTRADFNLDGLVNTVDKNLYWQINNSLIDQLD